MCDSTCAHESVFDLYISGMHGCILTKLIKFNTRFTWHRGYFQGHVGKVTQQRSWQSWERDSSWTTEGICSRPIELRNTYCSWDTNWLYFQCHGVKGQGHRQHFKNTLFRRRHTGRQFAVEYHLVLSLYFVDFCFVIVRYRFSWLVATRYVLSAPRTCIFYMALQRCVIVSMAMK